MSELGDKLLAVHAALQAAGIPHAVGGAIAFAYCAQEARGTRDLDLNIFLPARDAERVFAAMPDGVVIDDKARETVGRDEQVRLLWGETPVDLFFAAHDFHGHVERGVRIVPFEGSEIPVIGCEALTVFKAMFNRTRDWGDIEEMIASGALDDSDALGWLSRLIGPDDPSTERLRGLLNQPR